MPCPLSEICVDKPYGVVATASDRGMPLFHIYRSCLVTACCSLQTVSAQVHSSLCYSLFSVRTERDMTDSRSASVADADALSSPSLVEAIAAVATSCSAGTLLSLMKLSTHCQQHNVQHAHRKTINI